MDMIIISVLICSYVGLLAQHRIKTDSIRWLTACLGLVGLIMVLESDWTSIPAVTGLSVSEGIVVLYSLIGVLFGGDND